MGIELSSLLSMNPLNNLMHLDKFSYNMMRFNTFLSSSICIHTIVYLGSIFQIICPQICAVDIDILYRRDVCAGEEFYAPYARLLPTRQPHHQNSPMLKLLAPGFMDVANHNGILCINGPAIVYTDIIKDPKCAQNNASFVNNWIPSSGMPQIYSHECFSINRLARDLYKHGRKQELEKNSRVFGNKVFGIYLLGAAPDYRLPQFTFFSRPDFGFKPANTTPWCIHQGASLAFTVNNSESTSHCFDIRKYNMKGVVTVNYPGNPMFCYREDKDDAFDTPFHREQDTFPLYSQEISWSQACNSYSSLLPDTQSAITLEFEPLALQLQDFRMIDPKLWSSQGSQAVVLKAKHRTVDVVDVPLYSKPHPPGSMFRDEPGWTDPSDYVPVPNIPGSSVSETTAVPSQNFKADTTSIDCEDVPTPPDTCEPEIDPNLACDAFGHVLTITETDWKSEKMKDGSWRLPILNTVNKIYEKICPQISKHIPSSLSRLFERSLQKDLDEDSSLQVEFNKPQTDDWMDMLANLKNCSDHGSMITFFKKKNAAVTKLKKQLEGKLDLLYLRIANRTAVRGGGLSVGISDSSSLDHSKTLSSSLANDPEHVADLNEVDKIRQQLDEAHLRFPYKILVGNRNIQGYTAASQVYVYREAAEVDHELDWALDAYWKIITTVLGYCYPHYNKKEATTFTRYYESFSKDFLKYISKAWVKGDNRLIYEHIYGDFVHGTGAVWIDACHNGAYQWSLIPELRPVRPLELKDGDKTSTHTASDGDKNAPSSTNFFLDNPAQAKLSFEHDDYYEESNKDTIPFPGLPELYNTEKKINPRNSRDLFVDTTGVEESVYGNDQTYNLT